MSHSAASAKGWEPPSIEELSSQLPQYQIEALLGRGGMGAVYKGRQITLDRPVAIKILSGALEDSDAGFTERFKNEARAMGKLNHPGIVGVYDFGQTGTGLLYIVMEYVDGTDVAKMIAQQGRLHTEHAMAITAHVCDALAYAHERGIIHRDIKPANIMVGYDGVVKVADFGLAKMSQTAQSGITQSNVVMGTLHYMAPEALTLGSAVDQRADVYAVGVMLYQMLTGKLPQGMFEMPSLQVPGLDPRYDKIVATAMRDDRKLRYASAGALRLELDAILTQPVVKVEASAKEAPPALNTQARPKRHGAGHDLQPQVRKTTGANSEEQQGETVTKSNWGLAWAALLVIAVFGGIAWLVLHQPEELPALAATDSLNLPVGTSGMDQVVDVDFTKSHKGFHAKTSSNAIKAEWLEGSYKLSLSKRGTWWPSQPVLHDLLLEDFVCEVEARVSGSSEGAWGLGMIRLAEPRHPWTGVKLDAASNVEVYSYDEQSLVPLTATRAGSADKWSRLRVESTGARLRIFLDGVLVVETQDMHRVKPCALTLFLEANAQFEAEFRSIRVWRPKGTGSTIKSTSSLPPATKELPFINTLGMKFVPVTIGGRAPQKQELLFSVWHTRVQDYQQFAAANPGLDDSWKSQEKDGAPVGKEPDHPVVGVSWDDAQAFCKWLTLKENAEGRLANGLFYRLPSDEEWSWAADVPLEAGTTPREKHRLNGKVFPWGQEWPPSKGVGNFADGSFHEKFPKPDSQRPEITNAWIEGYQDGYATTSPVGVFQPNRLGLYDMVGNAWQWCEDWWDSTQKERVLRGGSWINNNNLNSNFRHFMAPLSRYNYLGFRCVLGVSAISTSSNPAGSAEMLNAPSVASKNQLSLGTTVDLLRLIDPANDTVRGRWEWTPEGLKLVPKTAVSTIEFPYEPPEFYDFTIEFSVKEGKHRQVDQILTCQGVPTSWQMGAGYAPSGAFGLMMVDGIGAIEPNRTEAVALRERLSPDVRHRSTVQVRKNRIRAILDGKEILNWEGDFNRLDLESQSRLKSVNRLGIGGFGTEAIFYLAELKAADGSATKAMNAAPKLSEEMSVAAARGGRLRTWGNFYTRGNLCPIDVSKAAGYSDFVALTGDDGRLYALRKNQMMFALDSLDLRQPVYEKKEVQRLFRNRIWPYYQNGVFIIHKESVPVVSLNPSVGQLRAFAAGFFIGGCVCIPETGKAFWLPANGSPKQERPPPVDLLEKAADVAGISYGIGVVSKEGRLRIWNFEEVVETSAEYSDIVEIQGGLNFALCRKRDGSVLVWPPASYRKGYLPDPSVQRLPTFPPAVQIRCGSDVCAAQMPDGRWIGWGADPEVVAKISSIGKAVDIAIPGRHHSTTNQHGYVAWIEPDALSGSAPASVLASGANESPPALGGSEVAASAGKSASSRNGTITDAVPLPEGPTTWTDIQGRSLVATFKAIKGDTVLLEIDGKTQPVALAKLSAASQELARAFQGRAVLPAAPKAQDETMQKGLKEAVPPPEFVRVPGGSFIMGTTSGDATENDARPEKVTVSEFYLQATETTKAQWDEVRAWAMNNGYIGLAEGGGKAPNHPVHSVSWWDAVRWCNARSEKEGLKPVYTVLGEVMRSGAVEPVADWKANGYRLPTEAEWEKAARGGVTGKRFPWGKDTISHTDANFRNDGGEAYATGTTFYHPRYNDGQAPYTSPVASFRANNFGLHDMAGNVWEWCWDRYTDSRSPRGEKRVLRGGSWDLYANSCTAANRGHEYPPNRVNRHGLRPARSLVP